MTDLGDARLYLVARATLPGGDLADVIPELADAGVDVIQLREKDMEAGDIIRVGSRLLEACRGAGVPFVLNDRPDVAVALGADGVHVGQNDLPAEFARRLIGEDGILGLSTHAPGEVDHALDHAHLLDYFVVGPVHETPTKPGRPAAGLELVRYAAAQETTLPWFAIGGIDRYNLAEVIEAGTRRIVVVRAITEAADPPAAAAELKQLLVDAG